jgi:hypothetical protein
MPPRAGGAGPAGGGSGVFLSYSHKDVRDVECLYQALVNQAPGIPVFMDRHSLAAGQKWLEAIQLHAGRASVLVCWGTDAFLRSSFTHYEVGLAEALGARIVPIVVDEKAWNQAPAYLSQRHSVLPAHPLRFDEVADRLSELLRDPALPGLPAPAAAGSGSAASGGS